MKTLAEIYADMNLEDEDDFDVAIPWLQENGFKVEPRELHKSFMWDGRSFNAELPDRHIIHDLAHLILAAPERKTVPEFGLGGGPETGLAMVTLDMEMVPDLLASEEECRAALLGLLIQHNLGMPCGLIAIEFNLISPKCMTPDLDLFREEYSWLAAAGHIDESGVPRFVTDPKLRSELSAQVATPEQPAPPNDIISPSVR